MGCKIPYFGVWNVLTSPDLYKNDLNKVFDQGYYNGHCSSDRSWRLKTKGNLPTVEELRP